MTPLLLALFALSSRPVHAQQPSEPAAYRETVREALAEYHAKNFPEARTLFAEAHELFPNARTLRGLGMTAFELRSYRESITFLTEALASQVKPLEGTLRAETERLLARASRFVGKLNLTVQPSTAEVSLDGNPQPLVDGTPLLLEVGEHTLEFRAEGYAPETRSVYIKGREVEIWNVVLIKLPPPAPVATHAPSPVDAAQSEAAEAPRYMDLRAEERPTKRPLYKNAWLWTGVGVAVVAIVTTSAVLATRDPEVGRAQVGENTPQRGGVFSALVGGP